MLLEPTGEMVSGQMKALLVPFFNSVAPSGGPASTTRQRVRIVQNIELDRLDAEYQGG